MKGESYFRRILMPVDGSHSSLHAEELAVLIAKNFKSKVTVIHVVSHDLLHVELELRYRVPPSVRTEITNWLLQTGNKIVSDAEALFREEGIEVDARVIEHEDPAEALLRVAKDGEHDLVVMGNRGETEVELFSLGSVAEKVSRHAECPVLIVKQKTQLSKILVAIDGHAVRGEIKPPEKLGIHGTQVALDQDICNGDGICISVCPVSVFEWIDSPNHPTSEKKSDPINEPQCIFCRACEVQCPTQAIKITEP